MLLSNRESSFKLSAVGVTTTFCVIFFFYQPIWRLSAARDILVALPPAKTLPASLIPGSLIPEKIWYKLGPRGLSNQSREWTDTCLKRNPTCQFTFMTDSSGDEYVRKHFSTRPDIVETYLALPLPILKADLLRYLLLFAEGGIWSDLDISCEDVPIREWIPEQFKKNASLVVGWEFDEGYELGWKGGFIRQFATWTIMAAPGSRHMSLVIDDIVEGFREKSEANNCTIANLTSDMIGDVVDMTGPRRMTRSIIKSLNITDEGIDDGERPSSGDFKLVEDVLILPGYSFANSMNRYRPQVVPGPPLVTHHYAGSWKNEHGGELADSAS